MKNIITKVLTVLCLVPMLGAISYSAIDPCAEAIKSTQEEYARYKLAAERTGGLDYFNTVIGPQILQAGQTKLNMLGCGGSIINPTVTPTPVPPIPESPTPTVTPTPPVHVVDPSPSPSSSIDPYPSISPTPEPSPSESPKPKCTLRPYTEVEACSSAVDKWLAERKNNFHTPEDAAQLRANDDIFLAYLHNSLGCYYLDCFKEPLIDLPPCRDGGVTTIGTNSGIVNIVWDICHFVPNPTPTPTPTPTPAPKPVCGQLKGDVNLDGVVNLEDAKILFKYTKCGLGSLKCPANADINHNGKINPGDAEHVLKIVEMIQPRANVKTDADNLNKIKSFLNPGKGCEDYYAAFEPWNLPCDKLNKNDANGNGTVDLADIRDIYAYENCQQYKRPKPRCYDSSVGIGDIEDALYALAKNTYKGRALDNQMTVIHDYVAKLGAGKCDEWFAPKPTPTPSPITYTKQCDVGAGNMSVNVTVMLTSDGIVHAYVLRSAVDEANAVNNTYGAQITSEAMSIAKAKFPVASYPEVIKYVVEIVDVIP